MQTAQQQQQPLAVAGAVDSPPDPPSSHGSAAGASRAPFSPSTLQGRDITYLMPPSPAAGGRNGLDYRPSIKRAQGQVPACLVNASVTYCGDDQIYAFGGFDQYTDEVYNHVLRLDLKSLRWELVDNFGAIPGVRMGHTATFYEGNKLIVFGGENEHRENLSDVVILDIKTSTWTQPEVRGPVPQKRARHAAVIYQDKLFIIGGVTGENNVILDDLSYLDLKTWTWSRTWSFAARYDHTAWVWRDRLWIFGGLGPDMERTTDLWWLDLKGSPSLGINSSQGTVDSPSPRNRMTYRLGAAASPSQQSPSRSGGYTANSASVQVRTFSRRRPTAPGAISCVSFQSGPQMPTLLSGTRFQAYASGALLDLITPSETARPYQCNLSSLDLDTLRWQRLADGPEIFSLGYRWHYCTINTSGTKAWLLGCNLNAAGNTPGFSDENHMSEILCIDLEKYGLLGNELSATVLDQSSSQATNQPGSPLVSGLGADLLAVFDQPPESGSGTDFIITADPIDPDDLDSTEDGSSTPRSQPEFLSPNAVTSPPIHVHRIILQLRWPHFKRLYSAQMAEYHAKRMHIPEPYSVVRAFLYYLYTDSISGHPEYCSATTDVAGMLVMANLYDMPRLRLLCVHRLSRELDVENAAIIWERASRTNEEWLMRRAAQFCLAHWGRIVRTDGFKSLARQSLIELCEVVDTDGRIVAGPELEIMAALGSDGLGLHAGSKRSRLALAGIVGDDLDEVDDEEIEGMDVS
ncbi:hypothetical protein ASPZODRAFT_133469 [Penicilliopsis zonata CBS 506.65]|uniref:BTB domain-containing protein n=1 Tax=Penicilliopsis zonata CBS 506.65 TaxID=1073090 RepID=A0A1L9SF14_9EURO|nr:hypothetical protein ASPZODRAFT_133469 [Penicilliopsis zonata CBS 506.65]OJJ45614.1 hypothetical protein ASPZODRAFT_133469 [Penicilliopsis zonata CBS 506.65]